MLLDLGLPDVDGLRVLAMMRAVSEVPVIVVTAQDDDRMVVAALDAGADDYVVKPFGIDQVAARIRAVLRRGGDRRDLGRRCVVGELSVDPRTRDGHAGRASGSSCRARSSSCCSPSRPAPGEVVTRRELLVEVWQQPYGGGDRTVDVHVSWLRRKLGETAAEPRYLRTVRGVGIRLVDPAVEDGG